MQVRITTTASQDLVEGYIKLATVTFVALLIYMAFTAAAGGSPMGAVICDVTGMITGGNLGKGVATLGIIVVGVGASIGKVSWGLAMTVGVGIAVALKAPEVVTAIGVGGGC